MLAQDRKGPGDTHNHLHLNSPEAVEAFVQKVQRDAEVLQMVQEAV